MQERTNSSRTVLLIAAILFTMVLGAAWFVSDKFTGALEIFREQGFSGVYYRIKDKIPGASPNVRWDIGTPESEGMLEPQLDGLRDSIADRTEALLVVRRGRLVYEYYAPGRSPNKRHYVAALDKAITASPVLINAMSDGLIRFDDSISRFVPVWADDAMRSRVRVRHIVSHSSGMDWINFSEPEPGWRGEYLLEPHRRFQMALETMPIMFEPGLRYHYSGVGFYALAYAVTLSLQQTSPRNIKAYFQSRVTEPLGIPAHDWSISYGESYEQDGMRLFAFGSGGSYTPRAVARIGQWLLDRGEWRGDQMVAPEHIEHMFRYAGYPAQRSGQQDDPPTGMGVWLNCDGFWPSLPRDAALGAGGGHQLLLMVPSLDLLVVRVGRQFGQDDWRGDYWQALEGHFFKPLMAAFDAPPDLAESDACGAAAPQRP